MRRINRPPSYDLGKCKEKHKEKERASPEKWEDPKEIAGQFQKKGQLQERNSGAGPEEKDGSKKENSGASPKEEGQLRERK